MQRDDTSALPSNQPFDQAFLAEEARLLEWIEASVKATIPLWGGIDLHRGALDRVVLLFTMAAVLPSGYDRVVAPYLRDKNKSIRDAAWMALESAPRDAALRLLTSMMRDGDDVTKIKAVEEFRNTLGADAGDWLGQELEVENHSQDVKAAIAKQLAYVRASGSTLDLALKALPVGSLSFSDLVTARVEAEAREQPRNVDDLFCKMWDEYPSARLSLARTNFAGPRGVEKVAELVKGECIPLHPELLTYPKIRITIRQHAINAFNHPDRLDEENLAVQQLELCGDGKDADILIGIASNTALPLKARAIAARAGAIIGRQRALGAVSSVAAEYARRGEIDSAISGALINTNDPRAVETLRGLIGPKPDERRLGSTNIETWTAPQRQLSTQTRKAINDMLFDIATDKSVPEMGRWRAVCCVTPMNDYRDPKGSLQRLIELTTHDLWRISSFAIRNLADHAPALRLSESERAGIADALGARMFYGDAADHASVDAVGKCLVKFDTRASRDVLARLARTARGSSVRRVAQVGLASLRVGDDKGPYVVSLHPPVDPLSNRDEAGMAQIEQAQNATLACLAWRAAHTEPHKSALAGKGASTYMKPNMFDWAKRAGCFPCPAPDRLATTARSLIQEAARCHADALTHPM